MALESYASKRILFNQVSCIEVCIYIYQVIKLGVAIYLNKISWMNLVIWRQLRPHLGRQVTSH
jgi:hypothetical protein